MPKCGTLITSCDLPIRIDSYRGCAFKCGYCNERLKRYDKQAIKPFEGERALRNFIAGKRDHETKWCDWNIPLRWGNVSDPFQPIERELRISQRFLEIFAESNYPFVVSTKSPLITEYAELIKTCNSVVQFSMVSPKYKIWEQYTPSYDERLKSACSMVEYANRVIIRCCPYIPEVKADVLDSLIKYRDAGIWGLQIGGMRTLKPNSRNTERNGNNFLIPYELLINDFIEIQEACHDIGLHFYTADGRFMFLSDSVTCCGCEDLEGFYVNKANTNYEDIVYTDKMQQAGTGEVFGNIWQRNPMYNWCRQASYKDCMERFIGEI